MGVVGCEVCGVGRLRCGAGLLSGWFLVEGDVVWGWCSVGDLPVWGSFWCGGVFGVVELRCVAVVVWRCSCVEGL